MIAIIAPLYLVSADHLENNHLPLSFHEIGFPPNVIQWQVMDWRVMGQDA